MVSKVLTLDVCPNSDTIVGNRNRWTERSAYMAVRNKHVWRERGRRPVEGRGQKRDVQSPATEGSAGYLNELAAGGSRVHTA
jgi:hypothetical protein